MARVVLASASPRRLELLQRIAIEPEVRPAHIDEEPHAGEAPPVTVARLAAAKARAVGASGDELVIGADTEVVLDGEVLGKPADEELAAAMLQALSGRAHTVITGVHLRYRDQEVGAVEETTVWFRPLAHEEIAAYVAGPEPYDKAGGYAIQGAGGAFVERIAGSDTNVVGLPLATVVRLAREVGVELLAAPGR